MLPLITDNQDELIQFLRQKIMTDNLLNIVINTIASKYITSQSELAFGDKVSLIVNCHLVEFTSLIVSSYSECYEALSEQLIEAKSKHVNQIVLNVTPKERDNILSNINQKGEA